jgi:predicted nuclease of predicted toxin-antitoxin system
MVAFFTDECFSGRIIDALRHAGFDIVRATDVCQSAEDSVVLAAAHAQGRILLTEDYDFGELCVRLGLPTRGVVIVSVKKLSAVSQGARVAQSLATLGNRVEGAFVTIEPARIRLRSLP